MRGRIYSIVLKEANKLNKGNHSFWINMVLQIFWGILLCIVCPAHFSASCYSTDSEINLHWLESSSLSIGSKYLQKLFNHCTILARSDLGFRLKAASLFSHTSSSGFMQLLSLFFFTNPFNFFKEVLIQHQTVAFHILCGPCVVAYHMNYVILTCHHPYSVEYWNK